MLSFILTNKARLQDRIHSPLPPLPAKVRDFSVEVFKKVEKCKDDFLRSDDTEKTSGEAEDGKKLETENGCGESVDAHIVNEGLKDDDGIGREVDTEVQIGKKEFVRAEDGEKERTVLETEVKEEADQEQESLTQGSNLESPNYNKRGDEEVAMKGEVVTEEGNDDGAEVSQDNDHCQGAENMEADMVEKVLKVMKMSVNNGREADSDKIDKIYLTNQADEAEENLKEERVKTEMEQSVKQMKGGQEVIEVVAMTMDEENKRSTDEPVGVGGNAKKEEVEKSKDSKPAENEGTGTMQLPIKAGELAEKAESNDNLNGATEVKEVNPLEETVRGFGKKELKETKNGFEQKEAVVVPIEIIEKVVSEEEIFERDGAEIKSDETAKGQPKEEESEENCKHDVAGNCKEMEVFEISNKKKGERCSNEVVWAEVVEDEEPETGVGHGHEDVEVKGEPSACVKEMETKKEKIIDATTSQEIEPGEEEMINIEADKVPAFELKEGEEVGEGNLQELDVDCVDEGTIKQQEHKNKGAAEKFVLPEKAQIVGRVVNTTEEVEAEPNVELV